MKTAWQSSMRVQLAVFGAACCVLSATGAAQTRMAPPPPGPPREPACDPAQLSFAVDREGGQFDGMSHSGTLLVLRNLGPRACSVPARPVLNFLDEQRKPLDVVLREQPGMHPGPVILPVAVPVGAELTSAARWVSSDAYGADNCVSPSFISLSFGGTAHTAPLRTHMCGPAGKRPDYSTTLFRRDPAYVRKPR